jgi:hypothetical protein
MADRCFLAACLALFVLACGAHGTAGSATPASSGRVVERAEGFEASPAWATKDSPWSEQNGVLSLVGHVEVAGDQRLEMAYRAADSYARAELLRFLKTRVLAVLEESTSSTDGESVKEQVEERAEGLVDDWLISTRYWEKREVDGKARLDAYSKMEVDQESVAALFDKAGLSDDLRLEVGKRLAEVWPELRKEAVAAAPDAHSERGISPPEWARSGDQESAEEFSFVCQGSSKDEKEALTLAKARCDEKLCRLLGVKIEARTSVTETLDDLAAESQVSETCDARIVGRTQTNKGGECGPSGCVFWLKQTYPRSEYKKELERLAAPTVIRQEVVIQEGDKHYKDPAACEAALRAYAGVSEGANDYSLKHLSAASYQARLKYLRQALGSCQGIDGRDSGLFQALNTILFTPLPTFMNEAGNWSGPDTARAAFAYVPAGFKRDLETKRFLTDRIQAIVKVCEDAILPMRVFDLAALRASRKEAFSADDAQQAAVVLDELVTVPFSDVPIAPTHRTTVHRIVFDPMFGVDPPISSKYRRLLLSELGKGNLSCEGNGTISAGAIIVYLGMEGGIDEEEWSAGLRYLQKGQDYWLSQCARRLLPDKAAAGGTGRGRARELSLLVASGKIARTITKNGVQSRPAPDVGLLIDVFPTLSPEDQLAIYLELRTKLDPKNEDTQRLATKISEANFVRKSWKNAGEGDKALCESLPTQFPPVQSQAPEFKVQDTLTCSCLELKTLSPDSRAALRKLWLSSTDESCRHFLPAEHPDGEVKWPYPKRRWGNGPFIHIDHILEKEEAACDRATNISQLSFSPTVHATLTAGRLSQVTVSALAYGTLSNLSWNKAPAGRKDHDWVRKADVDSATKQYEQCLAKAAEGYQVDPSDLQTKDTAPVRVWHQMGDQGSSNGFGE